MKCLARYGGKTLTDEHIAQYVQIHPDFSLAHTHTGLNIALKHETVSYHTVLTHMFTQPISGLYLILTNHPL